ncbi:MAG TPA: glycosyltransferase family 4 protein [Pseudoxanthomonas sp.]|nr:glycosyltransferase family 4 protein [Pseudoxanthomonas sp.]
MMRILMTADTIGGVWTYCMELCAALRPYGVSISLASMGGAPSADQRRQVAHLPHVTLYESTYKLCWMEDAWGDVEQAGEWLLSLERKLQPDIIHLNDLAHGNLDWQSPVVLVGHSCVLSWWEAVRKRPAPAAEWQRYRQTVRASLRAADRVVAPSTAMMDALIRHYGAVAAPSVIFNGRDFPALLPSPDAKIPFMEPVVLSAGRLWDEAKNVGNLAAIAPDLSWKIQVAGAQSLSGNAAADVGGLHHLGLLDQEALADRLLRATIYVAPARYEPFGLGVLEAARAGCALVLGDIASLREIWGDAAEYVEPDNPQAIRDSIEALIADPARLSRLMECAWRRAQRYSASRMAAGYMHLYQALHRPATDIIPTLNNRVSNLLSPGATP